MTLPARKSFRATLEPLRSGLGWIIARVPFDPVKVWPKRRGLRVRGEIEGFAFRTSLFAYAGGSGHFLLVNKKMLAASNSSIGSLVHVTLEPDLDEREVLLPPELVKTLKQADRRLPSWFNRMSDSHRREIGKWIAEPKSAASRLHRAEQMAVRLLETMEGETDPPPVLRAAFLRQPLVEAGWKAMTPIQRRGHLLGIAYYRTADARERRAAKAVEEALRVARKRTPTNLSS
jgi:uncharacterized protein YdeI (YjbR/CyaY-like superfamily)